MTNWTFAALPPAHPDATRMIRNYFLDIIGRYYDRPATWDEVDEEMRVDPSDDLPLLVVAHAAGNAAGCLGMRLLEPGTGELTRMFVEPEWRGHGVGALLIAEVERCALAAGVTTLRLDTRSDLVEARRLYASQGYREIPAYNDGAYAQHWFEKRLEHDVTR
ncbi:GNAT family N-acetyltransferase [Allokutzneria sp. NRRL B-24872]|uniref:GNAT family N-acetyltransferase n=1 Tax=Allokutzneria sp. NRRL B-24872 TaxID=1137961 RepID=UPI001FEFA04B|nr:GNAT family N-acetyltransferase [Allokutzneria sp. NRRL B-24872]